MMLGMGMGSSLGLVGAASPRGGSMSPRGNGSNMAQVLRRAQADVQQARRERDACKSALAKAQNVIAKLVAENTALQRAAASSGPQRGRSASPSGGSPWGIFSAKPESQLASELAASKKQTKAAKQMAQMAVKLLQKQQAALPARSIMKESSRPRSASPPPRVGFSGQGFSSPQPQSMMGSFASMVGLTSSTPPFSPAVRASTASPQRSMMDWVSGNDGVQRTGGSREIDALRQKIRAMQQQVQEVGSGWSRLTQKALRLAEQYQAVATSSTSGLHSTLVMMKATATGSQGAEGAMRVIRSLAGSNGQLMLQLSRMEDTRALRSQVTAWDKGVKSLLQ